MDTFGQKLKQVVASRGLRLEDVAQATGFGIEQLEAIVRDDYDALPDDDRVTASLQAFARLVEVDPDAVVDDYIRERHQRRTAATRRIEVAVVHEAPPVQEAPQARPTLDVQQTIEPGTAAAPASTRGLLAFGIGVAAILIAGSLWLQHSSSELAEPIGRLADPSPVPRPGPSPAVAKPEPPAPTRDPVVTDPIAAATTGVEITDQGVGTGVVDHQLVGEAKQFVEGTQVWFWTLVEGATPGDVLQHVWIREGRELLDVPLKLGGARWRTQSFKTLHPGSAGNWAVEARDATGHVLARRDFRCTAPAAD